MVSKGPRPARSANMETYPHTAKTFLREANAALDRLKNGKDSDDIHRALITFLNATKHSIQQLQTDFRNKIPGFDDWYVQQKESLNNDEFCRFFWQLRNRVTKKGEEALRMKQFKMHILPGQPGFKLRGPVKIGPDVGISVKVPKGRKYEWQPRKDLPGLRLETSWEFLDYPGQEPIGLCEQYLKQLDNVVDSFIERFTVD